LRRLWKILFGSVFFVLFLLLGLDSLRDDVPPVKDASQYVTAAWNLHHRGTLSLTEEDPGKTVRPSAYREPLYPAFLALGMKLSPGIRDAPQALLMQGSFQADMRPLKHMQIGLILITALCAMGIVRDVTRSPLLAWIALFVVGLDHTLVSLVDSFLSETLIAALLVAFAWCCVRVARRPSRINCGMAGFLLALMALTRAAFFYFWIPAALLAGLAAWKRPARRREIILSGAVFLACFFVPTGAWMTRNLVHFGRAFIAERGGVILAMRAGMDGMTGREYLASFLHWSNSRYLNQTLLEKLFDEEATVRLDPDAPTGFVQLARARRRELQEELGDGALADRAQLAEAERAILAQPIRHLLVTVPILHRGLYVKPRASHCLLLWFFFAAALTLGVRSRDMAVIGALSPALLSLMFHATLTHNIPRYNVYLIPFLWIAALACAGLALQVRPDRTQAGAEAGRLPGTLTH